MTDIAEAQPKRDPYDFPPKTDTIEYAGVTYKFRELTVHEMDVARDGATIDDKFDGRLMTRLMICQSAMEPPMDMDQLNKLPQSLYISIVDKVNTLNDPEPLTDPQP